MMDKYYIDENDLSRFNLFKVKELISDINKQLTHNQLDPLSEEELEVILITLKGKRDYIMDMRKQQSE